MISLHSTAFFGGDDTLPIRKIRLSREPTSIAHVAEVPPDAAPIAPVQIDASRPQELETGGVLTIDLAAITKNWKALAQRVVPAECAAVVKADAYGCGIEPVAARLGSLVTPHCEINSAIWAL